MPMNNACFTRWGQRLAAASLLGVALLAGAQTAELPWVHAEVRKVDPTTQKITLRHGEIPNLQMPGMTMVFQAPQPDLSAFKPGDKVRFHAEDAGGGALRARDIQPAP